ncbi:hypothetical protein JVT61DRAFT_14293 [Boletus reticuloceps]|uniref:Uncharacterized protein n=1 Tax=Boletus reticuloceps TaxID=495285 RepID=A0A8I3A370_9AGAM|nr:hypothetical protein JVT61DRAFT_14293 [Boletus reticuloceps]
MEQHIFAELEENVRLRRSRRLINRPIRTYTREGRAIRRLVSLSDSVIDLTREFDRRVLLAEGLNDIENVDSTDKQERTFRSYMKLVKWCPSILELTRTEDVDELEHACGEVSWYHFPEP